MGKRIPPDVTGRYGYGDVYFTDKAPRLKERTIETKRIMLNTRIIPYLGKLRMNVIKPADIMKWQNDMMKQGYKPTYLRMLQNQVTAVFILPLGCDLPGRGGVKDFRLGLKYLIPHALPGILVGIGVFEKRRKSVMVAS